METSAEEIAPTLIAAIETILNPNVKQEERNFAHKVCEEFKETSPMCVPVGLFLAQVIHKPIVRHFGLQLLEHFIKFRWNGMTQEEKEYLKRNALELMASGTQNLLEEEYHIKDAVSRITVELVKREWPQLWPSLQQDLYLLSQKGETQTELVLKTYLRIVEDAVLLQTIPNQRRREIMLALTTNMGELFDFFVTVLKQHTDAVDEIRKSGSGDPKVIQAHNMISEAALCTLAGYLDWVHVQHILAKNALLLQMTCLLLSNSSLQLYAAECLLIIVSRRGKVEERKPLLVLFSEDAMNIILNTAAAAEVESSTDEYYYLFLKKLCLLLVELGKQLCSLWGSLPEVGQPPNFSTYLEALLAFTQHSSRMLCSYSQPLWAMFFRHEHMQKDPILLSFIPKLFQAASRTLVKVGYPSLNDSPSCEYSRLDFDCDDDYTQFLSKLRSEISETLRVATLLQPVPAFSFASEWLKTTLEKPIDTGGDKSHCTLFSPSFLEWDAMTVCLECVMNKLPSTDSMSDFTAPGVVLLNSVLNYQTQDALIMSALLSSLSALFPFLDKSQSSIMTVLQKIFSAVTFNQEGQTKATRSKAVKNVRQHACSILVKMCKQYTDLIFPVFDQLYSHIKMISSDTEGLSQMEKCILIEALILISNQCNNFAKQSEFLEEILRPVKEFYLSKEFTEAFWDASKWMSFIGLDQAPVEPSSADTCGINRSHICYCTNMILAVLKRSKWPEEVKAAEQGGFVLFKREDGTGICRNPATSHISLLLENLLALMKTMNEVWQPQYLQRRHPAFSRCYELNENEKLAILGVPAPSVDITANQNKMPSDRMQNFIITVQDNNCHILGNAGQCLGYEFYTIPNLAQSLLSTALSNMEYLPDYRIKLIIRVLLKSYIQSCPVDLYATAVIPVFEYLCPFLYQRLQLKWKIISQRSSEEGAEENMESQEVIEDQLTRQLHREYMELLATAFHYMKRSEAASSVVEEKMEDAEVTSSQQKEEINMTELGLLIMNNKAVYPSVMMYVFGALTWSDTVSCHRACSLAWSMMKQLFSNGDVTSEIAVNFFYQVLCGLQVHGQHEGSQSLLLNLALQLYELLRPTIPDLSSVLLQVPNCKPQDVKNFDEKVILLKNQKPGMGEKKKKEALKRLVSEIIGKDIGQQFKREAHYRNLPPIFRIKPPKEDIMNKPEDTGLCSLFKPSNGQNR